MLVSNFDCIFDTQPKLDELTWSQFISRYNTHIEAGSKTSVPAISPAEWPLGAKRKKADVLRVHFAALDVDKASDDEIAKIREILEPYSFHAYTTWSHDDAFQKSGLWHLRVFLPFSRPVQIQEWKTFWPRLNTVFGGSLDQACKDPGRIYLVPSAPKGSSGNLIFSQEKIPLDVDALLFASTHLQNEQALFLISRESLQTFAKTLKAKSSEYLQNLGEILDRTLNGEPFAEPGRRDDTLFRLASLIAEKWPKADPKMIAGHFERSLRAMAERSSDAPTMQDVIVKIARRQEAISEEQRETLAQSSDELRKRINDAFGGERETPYCDEELEQFAKDAGVVRAGFKKYWIIQHGLSYYVFKGGEYQKPVGISELINVSYTDLAPASSAGIECFRYTQRGQRVLKSERELMQEYGFTAKTVVADLAAQKSHYDRKTGTFTEAVCPIRNLRPEFSATVDEYLRTLAGVHQEKLLDWVAVVTDLGEPCAALFIHGVSGAGKTLLADGLARLWATNEPTDIVEALGTFNEALTRNPLVLADEQLPAFIKKEGSTADLRSFIQGRQRALKRKFKPSVSLMGAIRLIITANNRNLFNTKETLTNEDIEAIKDRILYVYADKSSRDFLNSLTTERKAIFVHGDEIAKHALWLRDNRHVQRDGRFLVSGCDSTFHHSLTTGNGIRSAVCHWLTSYLQNPKKMDGSSELLVRVDDGQLLVTARALVSFWSMYETNTKAPTSASVSSALSGLSAGKRQLRNGKGVPTNYWKIRTEYLLSWNEENEYATNEEIRAALDKHPELAAA